MDSGDAARLVSLAILLVLSAMFSSAETALISVNRMRIRGMQADGDKRADLLMSVLEDQSRMLGAILIGNNVVNLSASALTTTITTQLFGSAYIGYATGILTLLVLVFGEVSPKNFAACHAEEMALFYAPVIRALMILLTPLIYLVNRLSRVVLRLLKTDPDEKREMITEDELRTIVEVSHEEGIIENEERKMINNVVDFRDSLARDIMVPRINMILVDVDEKREDLLAIFREAMFTRFPVYEESQDNIIGIINMKDFLFVDPAREFSVRDYMREAYFTYEFKKVTELFVEMRQNMVSMAVVLDEYGAVEGLVTMEDMLEEIVGEIRDEYDGEELQNVQKLGENSYLVEGAEKLDDLNEVLPLKLESEDYDSIGGFVIGLLDHLPQAGETVTSDNLRFTVDAVDKNRIEWIRIDIVEPVQEEEIEEEHRLGHRR